jgi:hypothetical protein
MITIDKYDVMAQQREAIEDWEFNHHGYECPFDDDDYGIEEVDEEVSPWA